MSSPRGRGRHRLAFAAWGLIGVGLAACGHSAPEARPTEEELAVLTEAMLIESALQDFSGRLKDSLAARYYDQLYDRYGYDENRLDGLRDRYGAEITLWERASDTLVARFERHRDSLAALLPPVGEAGGPPR